MPTVLTTIVNVLLPVPLSKTFDYRLPTQSTVVVGQRVLVEFGTTKQLTGIVLDYREATPADDDNEALKTVLAVLEDFAIVDTTWLQTMRFAARYYAESLGKAFKNALPVRLRADTPLQVPKANLFALTDTAKTAITADTLSKRAKKQRALLTSIDTVGTRSEADLRRDGFSKADCDKAVDTGHLTVIQDSPYRDETAVAAPDYGLNVEQQAIIEQITLPSTSSAPSMPSADGVTDTTDTAGVTNDIVDNFTDNFADNVANHFTNHFGAHLIYGVTGSGKTEVYIHLIEQAIQRGKQVLLLVPEIGLTPQMLARFQARFGRRVVAYHSELSDNKRRDIFLSALVGDLPIVVGTRSAIFLPFADLGLILIDEEHDLSYKQQEGFLYHARDLAIYRAKQLAIPVVMGSATPSLESMHNVSQGKLRLHRLTQRATDSALPEIIMVDRRGHGRENVLADSVMQKMRHTLQNGKQVLLFLNRRGFAPVMRCGSCGWSAECPSCSVFQTAHVATRQLCCHHCGFVRPLPLRCPDCGDADVYFVGAGTEKTESQLQQQFPQQRILRLDRDKQSTAKQLDQALASIYAGEVDIIIGTQLVVKGHHFPNVEMVCVVDADSALFSSDFRAEERLYQQLIQVAGRAGRESNAGKVYIQSNVPDHAVFHALIRHDYWGYAEQLLNERAEHLLPPYGAAALVKASALDKVLLNNYLRAVKGSLGEHAPDIMVLGPAPLAVERVKNRFQAQLWLSADSKRLLQKHLSLLAQIIRYYDKSNLFKTIVDVDAV